MTTASTPSRASRTARIRVKVEAPGFKSFVHPDVVLEVNQRGRVDVVLQLGAVSESVEVTGEAALLQTETTQVGVVISAKTIDNTPLISRNPIALTLLIPGVTATDPSAFNNGTRSDASGGRPYVNGNREEGNNFLLDGVDNNQTSDNLAPYQPNLDAIQEIKMITNNASAEFGNFQGGIDQRGDQVRHQPVPRQRVRVFPQRQAERQQLGAQLDGRQTSARRSAGTSSAAPSAAASRRTSCSSSPITRACARRRRPRVGHHRRYSRRHGGPAISPTC